MTDKRRLIVFLSIVCIIIIVTIIIVGIGALAMSSASEGCFIATAAYGTPMAEEIEVLRNFRDQYLQTTPMGETLVELYYITSPPIADFIEEHPALKPVVRAGLKPVIVISSIVVNMTLAQKIALVLSMVLVFALLVVWLRRRSIRDATSNDVPFH